ncbi:MAG: hypothetical protein MRJ65_04835 [Candidatus Brocadiaceae bacterium]|nr:hypothetical protein [Candidatus Brocadiaceae bacterium]
MKWHNTSRTILLIFAFLVFTLVCAKDNACALQSVDTKVSMPVELVAETDKTELAIGDTLNFCVRIKYRGDITVQFPENKQHFGVFVIKKAEESVGPKKTDDGYSVLEKNYILSTYEIGQQTIPSLKVTYNDGSGAAEAGTDEITITVKGVIQEGDAPADIKDIVPPAEVPVNYKRLALLILSVVVVFFFIGAVVWFILKRKKGKIVREEVFPQRPPHEIAYELLDQLSQEGLVDKGLMKEYYYRVTNIIRHYIEDRFGLAAPERTTEEFLMEMTRANLLGENHKVLIQKFLERCDLVKYAKYGPSRLEVQETFDVARRVIDETREYFREQEVVAG